MIYLPYLLRQLASEAFLLNNVKVIAPPTFFFKEETDTVDVRWFLVTLRPRNKSIFGESRS